MTELAWAIGYLVGAIVTGGIMIVIIDSASTQDKCLDVVLATFFGALWPVTWAVAVLGGLCWLFAQFLFRVIGRKP